MGTVEQRVSPPSSEAVRQIPFTKRLIRSTVRFLQEAIGVPDLDRERLIEFVRASGGTISFPTLMNEVLYGENAYYQKHVTISSYDSYGDFLTYSSHQLFADMFARYASGALLDLDSHQFIELAGGMGLFKKQVLAYAREHGVDIAYTSVDISKKLSKKQQEYGECVIRASALTLPFADHSVRGVIFANELVDAFPFVVTRAEHTADGTCFEELSYALGEDYFGKERIEPLWLPASQEVYDYWNRQGISLTDLPEHTMLCVNLGEEKFIRELSRVMDRGQIILVDYGDTVEELQKKPRQFGMRTYPHQRGSDPRDVYWVPYHTDITTNVNFTNLEKIAETEGFTVKLFRSQPEFLNAQLTLEERRLYAHHKFPHKWKEDTFLLDTAHHFKVLVLEK